MTFEDYLVRRTADDGPVGDLARETLGDPAFPWGGGPEDWSDRLWASGATSRTIDALTEAVHDWRGTTRAPEEEEEMTTPEEVERMIANRPPPFPGLRTLIPEHGRWLTIEEPVPGLWTGVSGLGDDPGEPYVQHYLSEAHDSRRRHRLPGEPLLGVGTCGLPPELWREWRIGDHYLNLYLDEATPRLRTFCGGIPTDGWNEVAILVPPESVPRIEAWTTERDGFLADARRGAEQLDRGEGRTLDEVREILGDGEPAEGKTAWLEVSDLEEDVERTKNRIRRRHDLIAIEELTRLHLHHEDRDAGLAKRVSAIRDAATEALEYLRGRNEKPRD